jgi:hypothetical protein
MQKFNITTIFFAALLSLLVGCGGGSSSGNANPTSPQPPPTPQLTLNDITGIYDGNVAQSDGNTFEVSGIIAPNGEVRFLTFDGEQLRGQITISNNVVTISPLLSFFSPDGYNGTSIVSQLIESGSATAEYANNILEGTSNFGGFTSDFTLTKNLTETEQASSLSLLSGNYVTENFDTSISIDVDGIL